MKIINPPKKSLGQNFLIDQNIIKKIVDIGKISKKKNIIEIGAGYGSLTNSIISKNPKTIIAIEKDKYLCAHLKDRFRSSKNIKILNQDFLKINLKNNFGQNAIIFGNLPYNVSTQILASLILLKKWPPWYELIIFMFQKEVANRILAESNSKEFSRLTVLSNWRFEIKKHFDVSNNCFFPKPKVDSTILSFKPKKNNLFKLNNPQNLEKITRILFSNRRKMINKNFKKLFKNAIHVEEKLKIDLSKRPGELNNEIFYKIAIEYEKLLG
jgi:16S rRNA (adenine1518-N6/adenine1519-N6)-dimethyltransferase